MLITTRSLKCQGFAFVHRTCYWSYHCSSMRTILAWWKNFCNSKLNLLLWLSNRGFKYMEQLRWSISAISGCQKHQDVLKDSRSTTMQSMSLSESFYLQSNKYFPLDLLTWEKLTWNKDETEERQLTVLCWHNCTLKALWLEWPRGNLKLTVGI